MRASNKSLKPTPPAFGLRGGLAQPLDLQGIAVRRAPVAVGSILAEIAAQIVGAILEFPIRGLGYALLRYCARRQPQWDDHSVLIVGLLGWLAVFLTTYKVWQRLSA